LDAFTFSEISNDLPIAVHLAFVIVHVAIIAGGLTGPSTPDHFLPNLMSKKTLHSCAGRTHRKNFACEIG
jgi:hypothetical protein